jgi:hypothetical protein
MAGESEVWLDAIARVAATIEGIKAAKAYAGGKGGAPATVVKPLPDVLQETPAALVVMREGEILAGTWERQTHTVELQIYFSREDLGDAYGELTKYPARVGMAFEAHSKAFLASGVQSSIPLNYRIEDVEWPITPEGPWPLYIVLIWDIQVKVNIPRNYQAA